MGHEKSLNQAISTPLKNAVLEKIRDEGNFCLPSDVMDILLQYNGVSEKIGFFNNRAQVSLSAFEAKLITHHYPRICQLLDYVVRGNLISAEAMIKENPEYLFTSGDMTDYSGRRFHRTALQSALASGDVCFREGMEECMGEMIIRHLKAQPNGAQAIATQMEQQFPIIWKENQEKENQADLLAVQSVFESILKAESIEEQTDAIQTFRSYLNYKYIVQDNKPCVRTTGFDFNHQMLLKAHALHDSYIDALGNDSIKNNLVWHQVIGYLQRFLPACDGMAFAQGFYKLIQQKQIFNRSLDFTGSSNGAFFPLLANMGLGYDFAFSHVRGHYRWLPLPGANFWFENAVQINAKA